MTTLGAVFLPHLPPERLRPVAIAADEAGLAELWLWEDCFLQSGIAAAAAALAWTERLHIGIGVLPVPLRNVALTAMEIAILRRLFPGRVTVGVGHGVQDWMAQVGARVDSPLTLLSEYLLALRALLRGETVTSAGRYVQLAGVTLDWPPLLNSSLYGAAVGPKSLRLCGAVADGTVLTGGTTPDGVRKARTLIAEGQKGAGRSTEPHPITVYLIAATGVGAADRLAAEHRRWDQDPNQDIGVSGDAAAFAEAAHRWAAAGADTVVFQPTLDEPDPEGFVRFIATEVSPLVR